MIDVHPDVEYTAFQDEVIGLDLPGADGMFQSALDLKTKGASEDEVTAFVDLWRALDRIEVLFHKASK